MKDMGWAGARGRSLRSLVRAARQERVSMNNAMQDKRGLLEDVGEVERDSGPAYASTQVSAGEIADLVSELEAHQIELDIREDELQRTRRELERAQEKYRDLYDFAPVGYLALNGRGMITEANLTFCSMTSQKRGDIAGRPLSRLVVQEDRNAYYALMHRLGADEREEYIELRLMRLDGSVFWCGMQLAPSRAGGYEGRGFSVVVSDISAKRAAEQKLGESERRYRMLLESGEDFIYVLNADGAVLDTNERAWRRLRYHYDEVVGRPIEDFLSEESQRRFRDIFPRMLEGEAGRHEFELVCKDGELICAECRSTAIEDEGKVSCMLVQRDLAERKKAERSLAERGDALRREREDMDGFMSVIRHEFANPILSIQGFGRELNVSFSQIQQLLLGQTIDRRINERLSRIMREDIGPSLDFIESSAAQMKALLDGLRQLARTGTVPLNIETLDMNELLRQMVGGMRFQIEARKAEIAIEELPGCLGDKVQVEQVLCNVLGNAIKYLDDERPGRIRIRGEVRDVTSVYCIEDNGIGMTAEQGEKAFDIFFRAEAKAGAAGEGLGLAIAKEATARLGGSIRVESEPGSGSRFFITLPNKAS